MNRTRNIANKVLGNYKMLGFLGFVEWSSSYLARYLTSVTDKIVQRLLPDLEVIKSMNERIPGRKFRVLYANAISKPQIKNGIYGIVKAYCKAGTLMTFDYWKLTHQYGKSRMNQMLIETVSNFKPDLIHLCKSDLLFGLTIQKVKKASNACIILDAGFQNETQPFVGGENTTHTRRKKTLECNR